MKLIFKNQKIYIKGKNRTGSKKQKAQRNRTDVSVITWHVVAYWKMKTHVDFFKTVCLKEKYLTQGSCWPWRGWEFNLLVVDKPGYHGLVDTGHRNSVVLAVISSIVINLFASVPLPSSPDGCLPVRGDDGESSAPRSLSGIHFSFIVVAVTHPPRTEVSRLFLWRAT